MKINHCSGLENVWGDIGEGDSIVQIFKNRCFKLYHTLQSIDDLVLYHSVHSFFSENKFNIELDSPIDFFGTPISVFNIDVINLGDTFLASQTGVNSLYSKTIFVSENDFISGLTMADYFNQEYIQKFGQYNYENIDKLYSKYYPLIEAIHNKLSKLSGLDFLRESRSQINMYNIKVKNIDSEKGIVSLTITDIACDIAMFINKNKNEIKKLLNII